ncbi:hypothetical protein [Mucilaginibacter pedocola]|uniref:hypothetical protein n=1 Tax=Mucilaginibacter pedocola TaxID=1792845 RepID=UPI0011808031|nr:hypothetical protein [Mucilaginibacter pedocola]
MANLSSNACVNCGAGLQRLNSDTLECKYCGSTFFIEREIESTAVKTSVPAKPAVSKYTGTPDPTWTERDARKQLIILTSMVAVALAALIFSIVFNIIY